jgi:hypothetical protein
MIQAWTAPNASSRSSGGRPALLALAALSATGCLALYRPDQDLTGGAGGVKARVLEVRAEPFLRGVLEVEAPAGTRLRGVALVTEPDRCDGAPVVLQTTDGRDLPLPAALLGRRLEVFFPDPRRLSGSPTWLALAFDPPAAGCVTVPLVAPAVTWKRQRAWGTGGFARVQSPVDSAAGSGMMLSLGGWWRHSPGGPLGFSGELGFTAGWCGDSSICEEARVFGLTAAVAGQLRIVRTQRSLVELELAAEGTPALSTGTDSPWLMGGPRATVRAWRTGPRLLGFSPDLSVGALGLELSYGYRFIGANGRSGRTSVIGLGLVVQPAL